MSIATTCTIIYFAVGIFLAFIWWNDEYKPEAEVEEDKIEDSMACIFLCLLIFFWPIKLIKNWFEGIFM